MNKIKWCIKNKNGLNLIEPNLNLTKAYIKKAEEALESINVNIIKDWKITTAYYTIYFSLYAILIKLGIKCEMHSCTIEFAKKFLKNYFNKEELDLVEESLKARINSQYYINKTVSNKQYNQIIQKAPQFLIKSKFILPN